MGQDLGAGAGQRYARTIAIAESTPSADQNAITELIDSPVIAVEADTSVEDACEVRDVPAA